MELKYLFREITKLVFGVLIIPYGIEIFQQLVAVIGTCVLIIPYGIEMTR